jgi:hypothetical protein
MVRRFRRAQQAHRWAVRRSRPIRVAVYVVLAVAAVVLGFWGPRHVAVGWAFVLSAVYLVQALITHTHGRAAGARSGVSGR